LVVQSTFPQITATRPQAALLGPRISSLSASVSSNKRYEMLVDSDKEALQNALVLFGLFACHLLGVFDDAMVPRSLRLRMSPGKESLPPCGSMRSGRR
jgi:hypothetical protein